VIPVGLVEHVGFFFSTTRLATHFSTQRPSFNIVRRRGGVGAVVVAADGKFADGSSLSMLRIVDIGTMQPRGNGGIVDEEIEETEDKEGDSQSNSDEDWASKSTSASSSERTEPPMSRRRAYHSADVILKLCVLPLSNNVLAVFSTAAPNCLRVHPSQVLCAWQLRSMIL
jgi:hypothetical protein